MKKVIGFYIDEKVKEKFEKYCTENLLNKAQIIEKIIKEFLNAKTKD